MNDLVMLLPHGYEGQGPEHSSARMERFLILCADYNMQVANCTTPANFFHLLRRQLHREIRKPLVVFTPKSLLRHPKCVSPLDDFSNDVGFREVIDAELVDVRKIKRVVLCSGKTYYDLLEEQEKLERWDTAIIRIEQLYPFPKKKLIDVLTRYGFAETYIWVQEEPVNMGAWSYISRQLTEYKLIVAARPEAGSPAGGSIYLHNLRQRRLVEKAFGEDTCPSSEFICNDLRSQKAVAGSKQR